MSDLISRSALIESWCAENCGNRRCRDSFDKCMYVLHAMNQPCAYDVDKVVEQLEEHKQKYVAIYEKGEYKDSHFFKGKIDAFDVAKNIVRAVGKE